MAEASRIPDGEGARRRCGPGRATRAGGAARAVPGCLPRAQALPIGAQATAGHAIPAPRRLTTRVQPLSAADRRASRDHGRALALPASMAYADIAGLPVTAGLYSLLLPLVVYALLGSAPWLVVGPESTIALLVAAGLAPLAVAGTAEYTTLAAADRTTRSSPWATSLRIWVRPMPPRWPWRPPPCGS
ncbi:MAG TPA: SulP family inorganic anion transporter [Jiangellaceae bacterium]|nr:SulP family inorganic anion transporter [Jiangellaceae bacterium]